MNARAAVPSGSALPATVVVVVLPASRAEPSWSLLHAAAISKQPTATTRTSEVPTACIKGTPSFSAYAADMGRVNKRARIIPFALAGIVSGLVVAPGMAFNSFAHGTDSCGEIRLKILNRDISRQLDGNRKCRIEQRTHLS